MAVPGSGAISLGSILGGRDGSMGMGSSNDGAMTEALVPKTIDEWDV